MVNDQEEVFREKQTSLSFINALKLIHYYGKGSLWIRHCAAVSRLADRYAGIFSARYALDTHFIKTAALLHDIGRFKTHDPIMHGVEGYRLLCGLGHPREAFVCASHVLFGLSREEAVRHGLPDEDFIPQTFEEQLIPVVDSLVELDGPTTIDKRLASIRQRYKGNDFFLHRIEAAAIKVRRFIGQADDEFGISMEQVASETLSR